MALTDITDARVLADQILWAATMPAAKNQAFNIVNGGAFRWGRMWKRIADWFGVEAAPFTGESLRLETQLADAAPQWRVLAGQYGLKEPDLHVLASAWHTDADLGRPIEVVTDMSKSCRFGVSRASGERRQFFDLFMTLRHARLIP